MPSLRDRCEGLLCLLVGFDPAVFSGDDCRVLTELLARVENACAGARSRAAVRAAACGAHKSAGYGDAAEWLARSTGSSLGTARQEMRTAEAVEACPEAGQALREGKLSLDQAGEITRAETDCPGSAADLVPMAVASGLGAVRDEARRRRLAAVDAEELAARQHKARSFRHRRDAEGMVRFSGALPPRTGVGLVHRLEAEASCIRREARREGSTEAFEAHAADALVRLAEGVGRKTAGRADVVFVCDLRAYRRGRPEPGEPCHLLGGGPVPVSAVARELPDAFVKAVIHDGVRIETVAHFGRHIPAVLRTALDLGEVPGFEGARCVGCGRTYGLEVDHLNPVANGGETSADNLDHKCTPCHWDKTERDRAAGLLGAPRGRGG